MPSNKRPRLGDDFEDPKAAGHVPEHDPPATTTSHQEQQTQGGAGAAPHRYGLRVRSKDWIPSWLRTPSRRTKPKRDNDGHDSNPNDRHHNVPATSNARLQNQQQRQRNNFTPSGVSGSGARLPDMSGTKWREEQILIICPGSRTTMAQLGCSELTPPLHRFPTRMFRDGDDWRPYQTYKRNKVVDGVEQEEWVEDTDSDEGAVFPIEGGRIVQMEAFLAFLDHVHTMLTTTYHNTPIMLMASPQWTRPDCEAIAQYIFEKTRTPSLCLIHSAVATQYGLKVPNMTVVDIGFEKVDVTAIHDGRVVNHVDVGGPIASAANRSISGGEVFTQRLMKLLEGKGFNHDMAEQLKKSTICEVLPYAPGEDTLAELPDEDEAQAEVAATNAAAAAAAAAEPVADEADKTTDANGDKNGDGAGDDGVLDVASIVTSGQTKEFLAKKEKEKEKGKPGRKPKEVESAASRVARLPNSKRVRNTFGFEEIVQEEVPPEPKEKPAPVVPAAGPTAAPTAAPETNGSGENPAPVSDAMDTSGGDASSTAPAATTIEGEAAKPVEGDAPKPAETAPAESIEPKPEGDAAQTEAQPEVKPEPQPEAQAEPEKVAPEVPTESKPEGQTEAQHEAPKEPEAPAEPKTDEPKTDEPKTDEPKTDEPKTDEPKIPDTPEYRAKRIKRDIEVGLERFTFADREEIDRIVNAIYHAIQGIDDMYMRPACWDNLVFVGNGARLQGLKENIIQTLTSRHLVSPSTATMFTSELPSNMATPTGTGSQTPTGSFTGAPHQLSTSGVNPLLQAATTANSLGVAGGAPSTVAGGTPQAGSETGGPTATHHFHSQTPTSIKTLAMPSYLQEWTKHGFEEAMFLGAQVAARIVFCLHSNLDAQSIEAQRMATLSRVDYNEYGPKAIRNHSMLG